MDSMQGQPPETVRAKETIKAEGMAVGSGGGAKGGRSKRNEVVREVMKKHGLSLPQASKFVKEHNLY
jgi:protein-tyrosine-phosphatase